MLSDKQLFEIHGFYEKDRSILVKGEYVLDVYYVHNEPLEFNVNRGDTRDDYVEQKQVPVEKRIYLSTIHHGWHEVFIGKGVRGYNFWGYFRVIYEPHERTLFSTKIGLAIYYSAS